MIRHLLPSGIRVFINEGSISLISRIINELAKIMSFTYFRQQLSKATSDQKLSRHYYDKEEFFFWRPV